MGKFLFWAIVIIAALMAARLIARHQENGRVRGEGQGHPPTGDGRSGTTREAEAMVRCEHCGIHLPRSEAVLIGGHTWCSQEHARLGHRQ